MMKNVQSSAMQAFAENAHAREAACTSPISKSFS
jgi:hypothetical protein